MNAIRNHGTGLRDALWRWWHGSTDLPQVKDPTPGAGQPNSLAGRWPEPANLLARRITATRPDVDTKKQRSEANIGEKK
jgi:hypothetical protein